LDAEEVKKTRIAQNTKINKPLTLAHLKKQTEGSSSVELN